MTTNDNIAALALFNATMAPMMAHSQGRAGAAGDQVVVAARDAELWSRQSWDVPHRLGRPKVRRQRQRDRQVRQPPRRSLLDHLTTLPGLPDAGLVNAPRAVTLMRPEGDPPASADGAGVLPPVRIP